jgi:hypothetical protein
MLLLVRSGAPLNALASDDYALTTEVKQKLQQHAPDFELFRMCVKRDLTSVKRDLASLKPIPYNMLLIFQNVCHASLFRTLFFFF